jgi:hypothetical protein
MRAKVKTHMPALLCALMLILCYGIVRPYAEMGIDDDWSYVKSAQVLAQTGRIVYNGWASPMLGWQLYFGALFVKLFGFSFTAVRFSTLIEAMATAFLLERSMVLAGINEWNATLATMTFVLSPLYLPLTFTFMTDVSGVLCIVLCLYLCLRALRAESQISTIVWIGSAALLNAAAGTARQIAWLGVLVMVPSTLWLLRRDRRVVVIGGASCIVGAGFVFAAMHWFARQPFTVPEPLLPDKIDIGSVASLGAAVLRASGKMPVLLLPVLLMFVGPLRGWNRRTAAVFAVCGLCFVSLSAIFWSVDKLSHFLNSFLGVSMTITAFQSWDATRDLKMNFANYGLRLLLIGATGLGLVGFAAHLFGAMGQHSIPQRQAFPISWLKLGVVLGPFTFAYVALLMFLAADDSFRFRYLLPLQAICLLVLARYYQQKVATDLPRASIILIAIFAAFTVAATHDEFALYRGYLSVIDEIRSSGVPATSIWGPWEYDGWTEIEKTGYVVSDDSRTPNQAFIPPPARAFPPNCNQEWVGILNDTPAIKPLYGLSLSPTDCDGLAGFRQVNFRTWIAPHYHSIYVVKLPPSLSR